MSDSDDSYSYEDYHLEFYEEDEGPPLVKLNLKQQGQNCDHFLQIKKKSRLIAAVVQNQTEILQGLLDSPKWYNVCDKWGYSLLQIAILCDNVEVFDYLLSIPDFPLEFVNKYNQTALMTSLEGFVNNDIWMKEHFAFELINKGANIDHNDYAADRVLHLALERSYFRTATLLIQKGVEVNSYSNLEVTPLEQAVSDRGSLEVIMALLISGAEPSVSVFEDAILNNLPDEIEEIIFLLLFDEYSKDEISWDALVRLGERNIPLLEKILNHHIEITFKSRSISAFILSCCSIKKEALKLILAKVETKLSEDVLSFAPSKYPLITIDNLENLEILLESNLRSSVISFITNLDTNGSFRYLYQNHVEQDIIKTCCYLLSYGLTLREDDLNIVYHKFGYGEFFKILLHMDIRLEIDRHNSILNWAWPVFLYSVDMDLEKILQSPQGYSGLEEFLDYFRDPRLVQLLNSVNGSDTVPLQVPLLVELARNTFNKFFIKTFNITTSRMFYTLVNSIPINKIYKTIITYEKKLYI